MTPERMFHELLGLGLSWEVTESHFDRLNSTVVLEIRETNRLWESESCPADGGRVYCYDHVPQRVWRHLNVFEHRCEIHCAVPRKRCRQCGRIYRVEPPWEGLSGHLSREFEAYALLLMREMPMAQVARTVGESDTRLWRMLFKHVEEARSQADWSRLYCLGVDELSRRKGHHYISVFADWVGRQVLFATEGKDAQCWSRFGVELEAHHGRRESVRQASIDMNPGYKKGAAQTCPQAQVVFDKFHVLAKASAALDRVRQRESRQVGRRLGQRLRQSRWLWRRNPEELRPKEKRQLEQLLGQELCTAQAYRMQLALREIYRRQDPQRARRGLRAWCRWVRWAAKSAHPWLFGPLLKLARMLERNLEGILAHWKWGLTNAFMEGLNSLFQASKRKARGYRTNRYFILIIYLTAGHLRLPQL